MDTRREAPVLPRWTANPSPADRTTGVPCPPARFSTGYSVPVRSAYATAWVRLRRPSRFIMTLTMLLMVRSE